MEYTIQNLEYAVSVFYNGEQADRARAHSWLTTAQRVPEAWNFVWELLQPAKATEIQFYGATTLHTKILRCWNEVPPESYGELKDKLMQAIFSYAKGPKIVTNRLCISLAAFILQEGTSDLGSILRPLSTPEHFSLLLDVLTVLPEEYNSMTMGSSLRAKNRAALQKACPAVLDDMLRYLQTVYNDYSSEPPSDALVQTWLTTATCASSWLALGGEEGGSAGALPERLPLCRALQTAVCVLYNCNEAVSDIALEACEACLSAIRAAGAAQNSVGYQNTALQLITELASLTAPIMARDNVPNSINEELLSALITCSVSVSECHSRAIVRAVESGEGAEGALAMLEVLLAAQAAPGHYPLHETRSNLLFGAWYTLQDEVLNISEDPKEMKPIWPQLFSRLLTILVTKAEAPCDESMSKDDLELLRCYRQDIADTVMYCYGILRDTCWNLVQTAFASGVESRKEAALHVFLALVDSAGYGATAHTVLAMLQHALHYAETASSKRMLDTALDCLGGYAAWLGELATPRAMELAGGAVRACGGALQRSPAAAALALRRLCAECPPAAAAAATSVVHAAQNPPASADNWTRRQLAGAAGAAIVASPPHVAAPLLHALCQAVHQELQTQALAPRAASNAAEGAAALLAALGARGELCLIMFRAVQPALPLYAQNPDLVQPMFEMVRRAVTALGTSEAGLLLPMMQEIEPLVVTGFAHRPCVAGLELVRQLVFMLSSEWPETPRLLHTCISCSARLVAPEPPRNPDVTEALFSTLLYLLKKTPQHLQWIQDLLSDLVQLGIKCTTLWEAGAARAACQWLGALSAASPAPLQPHASNLVRAVLRCIGGATPRNCVEPFAELLLCLNRATWQEGNLGLWLREALAEPDFPTQHATELSKAKFIAAVVKEKSSKRRLLESVQEFSLVCRGLIGTEYARQAIASSQMVA